MADEWYYEQFENHTRLGMQVRRRLVSEQSEFQKIELFEAERYGRVLALDGVYQTSELDEHYYHEMLVHPAMTSAPRIRRALVIGGGDGGTAREVLKHPEVEQCVMVEIDARVVEACKTHLPTIGTAWDDPRLSVRIGDGIAFVKESDVEPFDVIFLDGSDPIGPSTGLYDEAFYSGCARVLAPDGIFALQSESPFLMRDIFLQIQETLGRVFPRVDPYFGPAPIYGCGVWSWTCASRGVDPTAVVDARAERIEAQSRYYNRDIHRGAFAVPNDLRGRAGVGARTQESPPSANIGATSGRIP